MRDRYIPPFQIETLEELIKVFGSWNHHAEAGGAWRLYSKEEHDDSPSRRDGVSAYIEGRYKKLLVTLIWKVAEALNSYVPWPCFWCFVKASVGFNKPLLQAYGHHSSSSNPVAAVLW